MSVTTTWVATPNRIETVWSFLNQDPSYIFEEEELKLLLGPDSRVNNADDSDDAPIPANENSANPMIDGVLRVMTDLRLIKRDNGKVLPTDNVMGTDSDSLLNYIEDILVHPTKCEDHGQGAFHGALSWFLMQNPLEPISWRDNPANQIKHQFSGNDYDITNLATLQQFGYWVRYLGFGWLLNLGGNPRPSVIIPDPTKALIRHLPHNLKIKDRTRIEEMVDGLALRIPVMEKGVARDQVEKVSPEPRNSSDVSMSTSFALKRLSDDGYIKYESDNDDPQKMGLLNIKGTPQISHITLLKNGAS